MLARTPGRTAGRVWMRLLTPAAAAALLVLTIGVPANAAGPLVGDDGVARSGTYTADVVPAWKAQLLVLHGKQQAGTMLAADATQWNAIIDAHGLDPRSKLAAATASASGGIAPMAAVSMDLAGTQVPQLQGNWCGPASAQSIVLSWHNVNSVVYPTASSWDGKSLSQYNLSSATYTNAGSSGGTDWVDNDMTRALNRWIFNGGQIYVQYTPTSVTALQDHVTLDMSVSMMIASDMSEVKGGSHYNYHPNLLIYHWTTIRGYASSGATLHFQDPAANTTVLGTAWANVAPYFSMSSASTYSFMTHNVTRGIAW